MATYDETAALWGQLNRQIREAEKKSGGMPELKRAALALATVALENARTVEVQARAPAKEPSAPTHAGPPEAVTQLRALLGPDWTATPDTAAVMWKLAHTGGVWFEVRRTVTMTPLDLRAVADAALDAVMDGVHSQIDVTITRGTGLVTATYAEV